MKTANLVLAALFVGGCAAIPIDPALMGKLVGKHLSVRVPEALPLPADFILDLGSNGSRATEIADSMIGAFGGGNLEQKLGNVIRDSAMPLSRLGAEAFKKQLEDADLFGSVVTEGGNVAISLGVARWGLAYNPMTRRLEPVLDLEATLAAGGLGTVWRASRSVKDLAEPLLQRLAGMNAATLLVKPQGFQDAMNLALGELSRQLVDELRKNPPQIH